MQRLLLDTHAFLWWLADTPELGDSARKAIADERNEVFVSAATGWEVAIKRAAGKLQAPDNLDAMVEESGFSHLPVAFFHGEQAGALPMHHPDPFDRMLIAQAQAEGLVIVTKDPNIPRYGVRTLTA
jgi:PIN domain nuclease of toxin-antitoxin system